MAEIRIPLVFPDKKLKVIGLDCFIGNAIRTVAQEQRSQVEQTVWQGYLYLQGPAEELKLLVPVIKKALTEYANWLLTQAGNLTVTEEETKW